MDNSKSDFEKFKNLSFEDFKTLAGDVSLSKYQKIGFPNSYRQGKELSIFLDIVNKLGINVEQKGLTILDIGPVCSELPLMILDFCKKNQHKILLVDSQEMLSQLPDGENILKFQGYFPNDAADVINNYQNQVNFIICYSIFHYVFYNTCIYKFIDSALSLLKPGGGLLIGDIPNISKRRRFFSTETGLKFHQAFTKSETLPEVNHLQMEPAQIDDGVIFGILQRYRNFGFETYLLPQNDTLPMYNRREDLLICKT